MNPICRPVALALTCLASLAGCSTGGEAGKPAGPVCVSGRYPHLAMFNHQGECGTGAVVPWADRLWVITYGPHLPHGSDDKLYEITADLQRTIRPESVGGTPADRMVHRESNQLVIGPYFIDAQRNVRVISPTTMPGRLTAAARHLSDPANKVLILDMEGMFYEVDAHSLAVNKLFDRAAPGAHAKGGYTSQGRFVMSNNGNSLATKAKPAWDDPDYNPKDPETSGILAEWDGKTWRTIERRQFTEVTGPGGIYGAPDNASPLWAVGWDRRSILLKLLDHGTWYTFRLPKADHTYDPKHGYHTEWPRIREVTGGKLLMNMHGQWFEFPRTFAAANTAGIRPVGTYLKITGDFCGWNDRIVFGCDDTAQSAFAKLTEFDTRNDLIGQSNSNLWFTTWQGLAQAGRPCGDGGPWVHDAVTAGKLSEPYLLSGYASRVLHLSHGAEQPVTFTIEVDADGTGKWAAYKKLTVPARGYEWLVIPPDVSGPWVRLSSDRDATDVTAIFHYGTSAGAVEDRAAFKALADVTDAGAWVGGVGRSEGGDRHTAGLMLRSVGADSSVSDPRFDRVGPDLKPVSIPATDDGAKLLAEKAWVTKPTVFTVDDASVLVVDGKRRFRLPKSNAAYDKPFATGWPRAIREIVTERALFNVHGSFYVLPRPDSGGVARIKPICTHEKRITDNFSWRGMIVLLGTRADAQAGDGHYFATADGKAGAWFGDYDDLWKLGKPRGHGGPWLKTPVKADEPSDAYLMTGFDRKTAQLSHDAADTVRITLEVDVTCDGSWKPFRTIEVPAGKTVPYEFPAGYSANWLRARSDTACNATLQLTYE